MSSIALSRLLFPEPLAPKTPATGKTSIGDPPSRHVTDRTYAFSNSGCEKRELHLIPEGPDILSAERQEDRGLRGYAGVVHSPILAENLRKDQSHVEEGPLGLDMDVITVL